MLKNKQIKTIILTIIVALSFISCSSNSNSNTTITGTFVDDPVEGLTYSCSSGSTGTTNANGEYNCPNGDDVTFSLGSVVLGTLKAQEDMITPYSLFPNNATAALNLARILQSIGDTANGTLSLNMELVEQLNDNIDFRSENFEEEVQTLLDITLVSASQARETLNESISSRGGEVPLVGIDGQDGEDGEQGIQGEQGEQGEQGPAGEDGIDGQDGADGEQGPTGQDGETGPAGQDGISINWLGDLSGHPSDPSLNDAYRNITNNNAYIYDGNFWKIMIEGRYTKQQSVDALFSFKTSQTYVYLDVDDFTNFEFYRASNVDCDVDELNDCTEPIAYSTSYIRDDVTTTTNEGFFWLKQGDTISNNKINSNFEFSKRYSHQALSHDGKLWVIGGDEGSYKNDVWYSSDGISWTEATASANFSARISHQALSHDGKLWVIGGYDGSRKNDIWYSSDGITWTEATASANFSARDSHQAISHDGKLWVIGGNDGFYKNDVWYSSDGISWTEVAASANFSERYRHQALSYDGKLWVIGGFDGSLKNDVWSSTNGEIWHQWLKFVFYFD